MTPQIKNILVGAAIGAVVTALVFMLFVNGAVENLDVEVSPGKQIKVKMDGKKINDTVLLNSLWSHDYTQAGMIGWLNKKGIYRITDPQLKSDTVLLSLLWKDGFTRAAIVNWLNNKGIYDINDQDKLINAIKELPEYQKIIDEIKKLDAEAKPAFIDEPDYTVPKDTAFIWTGSPLNNKKILFTSEDGKATVSLLCLGNRGSRLRNLPEYSFHVNSVDRKTLLGDKFRSGKCFISVN
jgi:hypothetical protein